MVARWDRSALLANPVFASLHAAIAQCPADRFPSHDDLNEIARARAITSGGGAAIRFVAAAAPHESGLQYEARIHRDGEVRTRPENHHDLFNALAWLAFPNTKAALNRRHCEALGKQARRGSRGAARDVLTLFDESGAVVACSRPALGESLRRFEWKTLFWTHRDEIAPAMRFFVFGHAIYEKGLRPYKGVTARALILPVAEDFADSSLAAQVEQIDAIAASRFDSSKVLASTRMLAPLPILGVPGWDPQNESESFYEDASVFRPGRRSAAGTTKRSPPVRGA